MTTSSCGNLESKLFVKNDSLRGAFGAVFLVKNNITSEFHAMKVANKKYLKRKKLGRNKNVWSILNKEIAIMKKMVRFAFFLSLRITRTSSDYSR
jgi:hypothetical protein